MSVLDNITLAPRKVLHLSQSDADARGTPPARADRAGRQGRRVPRPSVGRAAATCRDRACARDAAEAHALRRDHERARPRARERGAPDDARARRAGDDDDRRDPRDGLRARRREQGLLPAQGRRSSRRARRARSSPTRTTCGRRSSSGARSRPVGSGEHVRGDGPCRPSRADRRARCARLGRRGRRRWAQRTHRRGVPCATPGSPSSSSSGATGSAARARSSARSPTSGSS